MSERLVYIDGGYNVRVQQKDVFDETRGITRTGCTSCALCAAEHPDIFVMGEDGLAKVVDGAIEQDGPYTYSKGSVATHLGDAAIDAAQQCPSEAILVNDTLLNDW